MPLPCPETVGGGAWDDFPQRWKTLVPPLRPDGDVCAAISRLVAHNDGSTLLLGVTPELASVAPNTIALDWSARMIDMVWPGNTHARRAIRANWLNVPCAARSISSAIGDGSLNCLRYSSEYVRLFEELGRSVCAGGRLVVRVFLTPERGESLAAVRERTLSGEVKSIHALKWLLAHALCKERAEPNVDVREIHRAFCTQFSSRRQLRDATGWSNAEIGLIDLFESVDDTFSFPTARQLHDVIPDNFVNARLVPAGTYELSERCPLLVTEIA
jgi:hypothetical protein